MSVLLYLVYVASSSSLATSTPISSDPLYQRILPSNSSLPSPTQFGQRSTWDIVWGCLTMIFACSWVSVHPPIPPLHFRWWEIALIRFGLMLATVFAPEITILWAVKEYVAASALAIFYKERGWTITHGFFIQMGGFMLYDGVVMEEELSPRRFRKLLEMGKITFPEITEAEIEDRSKGDGLSKALVFVQVAWFITQFAARIAEGLAITQLELATFAIAVLNAFMFFFWLHKPLDIRLPIPIHLLHPPEQINEGTASHSAISSSLEASVESLLPEPDQPPQAVIPIVEEISDINGRFQRMDMISGALSGILGLRNEPDFELLDTVPMFFSSSLGLHIPVGYAYWMATILAMVFGTVHCTGWNLVFPSTPEQYMWRISSVIMVVYPPLVLFHVYSLTRSLPRWLFSWSLIGYGGLWNFYMVGRLFVMLEAGLALRTLPESATYTIQWTTFLPHL